MNTFGAHVIVTASNFLCSKFLFISYFIDSIRKSVANEVQSIVKSMTLPLMEVPQPRTWLLYQIQDPRSKFRNTLYRNERTRMFDVNAWSIQCSSVLLHTFIYISWIQIPSPLKKSGRETSPIFLRGVGVLAGEQALLWRISWKVDGRDDAARSRALARPRFARPNRRAGYGRHYKGYWSVLHCAKELACEHRKGDRLQKNAVDGKSRFYYKGYIQFKKIR